MEVRLDYTKSLEENASRYFDRAKKAKRKCEGARATALKWEQKLESAQQEVYQQEEEHHTKKRKKRWYEKFRWFYTSEGMLVIGGRDATTNELVIKKHMEDHDLVFHTDMAGSPFFVLKTAGDVPTDATLREVADATCTFSRAWKFGLTTQSVFYVKSDQVTKHAPSGEYVGKGAFMITGKTQYIENQPNLAIGAYQGAIMAGPEEAIAKHCDAYVTLTQGDRKASETAKKIRKAIGGDLDEIIRALPAGTFKILGVNKSV